MTRHYVAAYTVQVEPDDSVRVLSKRSSSTFQGMTLRVLSGPHRKKLNRLEGVNATVNYATRRHSSMPAVHDPRRP
jgi:hypothetical protein